MKCHHCELKVKQCSFSPTSSHYGDFFLYVSFPKILLLILCPIFSPHRKIKKRKNRVKGSGWKINISAICMPFCHTNTDNGAAFFVSQTHIGVTLKISMIFHGSLFGEGCIKRTFSGMRGEFFFVVVCAAENFAFWGAKIP